jgi:hypothetical protein
MVHHCQMFHKYFQFTYAGEKFKQEFSSVWLPAQGTSYPSVHNKSSSWFPVIPLTELRITRCIWFTAGLWYTASPTRPYNNYKHCPVSYTALMMPGLTTSLYYSNTMHDYNAHIKLQWNINFGFLWGQWTSWILNAGYIILWYFYWDQNTVIPQSPLQWCFHEHTRSARAMRISQGDMCCLRWGFTMHLQGRNEQFQRKA